MKLIYKLKKGKYQLEHFLGYNSFGLPEEGFVAKEFNNDEVINYPFMGTIKVEDYTKDSPIKIYTKYTKKEYAEMLKEMIKEIKIMKPCPKK